MARKTAKPAAVAGTNDAAMAAADAMAAAASALAGAATARTTSNVEGRTTKDADRSETATFSMPRRDSDVGVEEGWSQFILEASRRDRVHFDNGQFDSRRHANESAERTAMLHKESITYLSSLAAQVLDAQKLGTNNMWTASNELEFVVQAVTAKVLAGMGSK